MSGLRLTPATAAQMVALIETNAAVKSAATQIAGLPENADSGGHVTKDTVDKALDNNQFRYGSDVAVQENVANSNENDGVKFLAKVLRPIKTNAAFDQIEIEADGVLTKNINVERLSNSSHHAIKETLKRIVRQLEVPDSIIDRDDLVKLYADFQLSQEDGSSSAIRAAKERVDQRFLSVDDYKRIETALRTLFPLRTTAKSATVEKTLRDTTKYSLKARVTTGGGVIADSTLRYDHLKLTADVLSEDLELPIKYTPRAYLVFTSKKEHANAQLSSFAVEEGKLFRSANARANDEGAIAAGTQHVAEVYGTREQVLFVLSNDNDRLGPGSLSCIHSLLCDVSSFTGGEIKTSVPIALS